MIAYTDFDEAQAAVGEKQALCATLMPDGTPKYFVMAADTADAKVRAAAFEIREGRPMSEVEVWALEQAEALRK